MKLRLSEKPPPLGGGVVTDAQYGRLLDALDPLCEHSMSLSLCAGPGHYPMDM